MKKHPLFTKNMQTLVASARFKKQVWAGLFLMVGFALIFQACKTLEMGKEKTEVNSTDEVINGVQTNSPDYNWLNGRLKVKVSTPSDDLSGSSNLKMKKDSLIWLSISPGLGLEVMRARITPDSLHIINRIKQTYTASAFHKVNRFFPIRDVSFKNLQNLLLGQPAFEITPGHSMRTDSTTVQLTFQEQVWKEALTLEQGNLKVRNLNLTKPATQQSLDIQYQDYQKTGDYWLPGQLNMKAQTPEVMKLELQFKDLKFKDQDEASFNIPSGYERTQ